MFHYQEKPGLPLVVIFGRTNVGKSTLFNCLTEKKQALVSDIPGTTRDSNLGLVSWRKKNFRLIDTGGILEPRRLEPAAKTAAKRTALTADEIQIKVEEQARAYLGRADLILFLVDGRVGLLPPDRQMALLVKKTLPQKINQIILVANKVDRPGPKNRLAEFYQLSFGEPAPLSAISGSGTGDLLDLIIKKMPKTAWSGGKKAETKKTAPLPEEEIKVAIIGKPNVGKSSLLNSLVGEERVIVSSLPHTTREPQDILLPHGDKIIRLIDTAGISRKGLQSPYKKQEKKTSLEKYGIAKSLARLKEADLALLILDINEAVTHQETKIIGEITGKQKSLIIVGNKWDLAPEKDTKKYNEYIRRKLPFIGWVPIEFVSALTGERVKKILDRILEVSEQRKKTVSPSQLNTFLMRLVKMHKPTRGKGTKYPRLHGFEQTDANPPRFELRIGSKEDLHASYVQYISNRLRAKYGFLGTPIKIEVVKNRRVHGGHNQFKVKN